MIATRHRPLTVNRIHIGDRVVVDDVVRVVKFRARVLSSIVRLGAHVEEPIQWWLGFDGLTGLRSYPDHHQLEVLK